WPERLATIVDNGSPRERFYAAAYLVKRLGKDTPERFTDALPELYCKLPEAKPSMADDLADLESPPELFWLWARAVEAKGGVPMLGGALARGPAPGRLVHSHVIQIAEWLLRLASTDGRSGWGRRFCRSAKAVEYTYVTVQAIDKPGDWTRSPEGKLALKS